MKIVADENIPELKATFADKDFQFVCLPGRHIAPEDLIDADILIVRSVTKVNETLLKNTPIKFVGTCTIGTDHLDIEYLERAGIEWANAPGCNANSVVEYVFSALAALNQSLQKKRFGIIGCGNVGGHLHRRLKSLNIDCYCYDPFLDPADNPDLCDLETVLNCDIISMHTPHTQTGPHPSKHLISAVELKKLKPGALLINCGRGPVISNSDLLAHLQAGANLRTVLDVWEPEPDINIELLKRVDLASPHIAGYSFDGRVKGTQMIYSALLNHLSRPTCSPEGNAKQSKTILECKGGSWEAAVFSIVLAAYDIRRDDKALRAEAAKAQDIGVAFDRLRKTYPKRLEFAHFAVGKTQVSDGEGELLQDYLGALGFAAVKHNV